MSLITYKNLYTLTVEEIEKRLQFDTSSNYDKQLDLDVKSISTDFNSSISAVQYTLSEALPSTILDGLEVEATEPISSTIIINPGKGTAGGVLFVLGEQTSLPIALDTGVSILYIVLYQDTIRVQKDVNNTGLLVAKIIIPEPGVTAYIQDNKDDSINAYIVNMKEYKLYGFRGKFEEETVELLKDNILPLLAESLIGSLTLSEHLTVTNLAGSMILNSDSMQFFNIDGDELAYFGATLSRVGNISITPHTIESGNYLANVSGFQIQDNGDAEFNNIRLRATLYTSTIEENLYISPGVTIIGDLNFDDDIALLATKKIIFDRDMGSDTYWVYNPTTSYLEGWVDGSKRIEL